MPTESIDRFPYKEFNLINGKPIYATIKSVNDKLSANAASIHSTLSDGRHGLLGLVVPPNIYNTITNVPFVRPLNPGPRPIIPQNATARATLIAQERHAKALVIFKEVEDVDQALKSFLLQSFDEMYYKNLKNIYTGYSNVSTLQILNHLYSTYGRIKANDLKKNQEYMTQPWCPSNPIENLYKQIEDGNQYASYGNLPFSDSQLVNIGYNIIYDTAALMKACKEWNRLQPQNKTWHNFKQHFSEAYAEYEEFDQESNTNQYAANLERNIHEYAAMTQSQAIAIRELQETNASLTTLVQDLTAQIGALTSATRSSQQNDQNRSSQQNDQNRRPRSNTNRRNNGPFNKYCWTHGYNQSHNSTTCTYPASGHCRQATHQNRMDGSVKNQHRFSES